MFPTWDGNIASKAKVVEGWSHLSPAGSPTLSGHSARRSGIKRYARLGWSALALQLFGRWASVAVLGYIEEALCESCPSSNIKEYDSPEFCGAVPDLASRMAAVEDRLVAVSNEQAHSPAALPEAIVPLVVAPVPMRFWVCIDKGRLHERASISWRSPSFTWQTSCGIRFACNYSARAAFSILSEEEASDSGTKKCERCPVPPWAS